MGKIINIESTGKTRLQLSKAIVVTIRELARQVAPDENAKDMVAFVIIALEKISAGIETSVEAWEKRDYWVKADRFRMEWSWTSEIAAGLRVSLAHEDWQGIADRLGKVGLKLTKIDVPLNNRIGKPWMGSYKLL